MTDTTVTRMRIQHSGYKNTTRGAATDDRWDRGDTSTDWSVGGVDIHPLGDLHADFPVEVGDLVYVIFAIYSTGDSFGQDNRSNFESISVHKNRERAEENAEVLRHMEKDGTYSSWEAILTTDGGTRFPFHVPWLGYFESLDEVRVEEHYVEQGRISTYEQMQIDEMNGIKKFEAGSDRRAARKAKKRA
ncbi:MAG: hypothetical protein EOP83_21420 [Verrucomicrobiaceae bacterium]|nr:MAG: hypothetical protein EOP83_21420 [Verrucomicrobiaceae bacterium]